MVATIIHYFTRENLKNCENFKQVKLSLLVSHVYNFSYFRISCKFKEAAFITKLAISKAIVVLLLEIAEL